MNLFFGVKYKNFFSNLQIPIFKNDSKIDLNLKLFSVEIINNEWVPKKIDLKLQNYFYKIDEDIIDNEKFFFLAYENDLNNFNKAYLLKLNKFTETTPAFRASLTVKIKNMHGFSSYQSEYPFKMVEKKGTILSSVYPLSHINGDNNLIVFRNIYKYPIKEKFNGYILDIENKKIIKKFQLSTNQTNYIELSKDLISINNYLYTDNYIGVPIYLIEKNGHLSFEHTHPLHEYVLDNKKYEIVSNIKKKFNDILN